MQKLLSFYDSILSHNHPAFIGVLRISLTSAKAGTDAAIVKLYIVTLTFLPINILTGLFSLNVQIPHSTFVAPDGSPGGYHAFYGVLGGVTFVCLVTWLLIWLIFKTSRKQPKRGGARESAASSGAL